MTSVFLNTEIPKIQTCLKSIDAGKYENGKWDQSVITKVEEMTKAFGDKWKAQPFSDAERKDIWEHFEHANWQFIFGDTAKASEEMQQILEKSL